MLTDLADRITVIIINYKTLALTKVCYESFRKFYPNVRLYLIDNHSQDDSTAYIKALWESHKDAHLAVGFEPTNVGHGPALARVIEVISTPFVFTLDSDCEILKGGFLEIMLQEMGNSGNLYAIGWKRWVDKKSGVPHEWHASSPPKSPNFIPYIHPYAALYRLSMYRKLRPFADHGAPCVWNMNDAVEAKYDLQHMELKGYIKHWIAGTRRMFKDYWHPKDDERPGEWVEKGNHPI